jgi:hypothetical protein
MYKLWYCVFCCQNRHLDALALGMAFYQDKAKAVVGLKGPKQKRKEMARDKVCQTLCGHRVMLVGNWYVRHCVDTE